MNKRMKSIAIAVVLLNVVPFIAYSAENGGAMLMKDAMELGKQRKYSEAIAAAQKIISQYESADSLDNRLFIGVMYFKNGEYMNSLNEFKKASAIDSANPMSYYFMGLIYEANALSEKKIEAVNEMKKQALNSWAEYIRRIEAKKDMPQAHESIGIGRAESLERAKRHIAILKEGLGQ